MPQPQKNSRISGAIGAAPVTASRSRPPKRLRTKSALGCQRRPLLLQVGRDLLAADLEVADPAADLADGLDLLGRELARGQRVELLEDARDRGQVGRLDLHELGDDLLRVAAPVGDRRARVERAELDEQREGVGQRQEEVDEVVVAVEQPALLDHVEHRAVVAVREHAALGRPGGARRVDEREGVVGADRVGAGVELGGVAPAAALAQLVERDRVGHVARGVRRRRGGASAGRRSRTATIFATCSASSQTTATASELPTTHSHSSGEFVG